MRKSLLNLCALVALLLVSTSAWAQKTYEIGTASELEAFAKAVAGGETDANAKLTADIDYTGYQTMVGTSAIDYDGTFDGQGHKVTVAFENDEVNYVALIARIGHKGVIKNLITEGTITTSTSYSAGIVGANYGKVIDCASFVTINSSKEGDATDGGIVGLSYEGSRVEYCLSAVKINGPATTNCGTVVGWLSGTTSIEHCLSIAEMDLSTASGSDSFCRNNGNMRGNGGNYFVNLYNSYSTSKCIQITENELKSGYVCYALNGDQSDIHWYQNIGEDAYPVPYSSHKQVYAHGTVKCNGVPGGDATFDNSSANAATVPSHDWVNGYCEACACYNNTLCPEVDGVFQISTASQLKWFCMMQDQNFNYRSADLVADIDYPAEMGDLDVSGAYYYGTLNGNFHTLTLHLNRTANNASMIANLAGTVKNLTVAGTITTSAQYAAAVTSHLRGGKIYNVTSSVDIESSLEGDGTDGGVCAICETATGGEIAYCIFNGKMIGEKTTTCGGIVGWSNSGNTIKGCIVEPTEITEGMIEYVVTRNPNGGVVVENCYYNLETMKLEKTEESDPTNGATVLTADLLKSGEACFMMNGDQSVIGWTQNIGSEDRPNNQGKSAQVYSNAERRCDGKVIGQGTYSNDASISAAVPAHQYENGVCTVCGQKQTGFMEPDADGYYNIATPGQLIWFATAVNGGETSIKGRLTADIDMEGSCDKFSPIGSSDHPWSSTFDGQYHKISNLVISAEVNCMGLFGYIEAPATVKNMILDETCNIHGAAYSGMIGETVATSGTVNLINLGNEGTVSCTGVNAGGILGCCMSSSATINLYGCYTTGLISGGGESGALSGWLGSSTYMQQCWSISTVEGIESNSRSFARLSSGSYSRCCQAITDCNEVPIATMEQFENGVATYYLNYSTFQDVLWHQTLGEDSHPVYDTTHGIVYRVDGGDPADVHDDATFKTFVDAFTSAEKTYAQEVEAWRTLADAYGAAVDGLIASANMEEFCAQYDDVQVLKDSLTNCATAYATYESTIKETLTYLEEHPDMTGQYRDFLSDYLELDEEPGTYPNGAYGYIVANCLLNQEEITAETEYVKQMLDEAIRGGILPGTDVTQLLKNPTFIDGFSGWDGTTGTGYGTSEDNDLRAGECWASTMDMYQTLTNLQNGVYELKVNGAFRAYQTATANQYAAMLYLNDNKNYFQADIEDMIPVADAVDGVNCYITEGGSTTDLAVEDEEGNVLGYVMHGTKSACNAFSAGRYQNSILVNVTDGTLKVGIMQPGTRDNDEDWLGFGNLKLTYCGEISEAGDYLDEVLASQSARANTILNSYTFSDGEDYDLWPNFSQATKDALQAAIDAIPAAADNDAKYALIQKFSELFQEVRDCKEAYTNMIALSSSLIDAALELYTATDAEGNPLATPLMSEEEYNSYENINDEVWSAYSAGSYTLEQALNVEGLNNNTLSAPYENGAYQLSSARNVVWYASVVNSGNCKDAVLTADIDMANINMTPIGVADADFTGTFDGQGHTISNLNMNHPDDEAVGFIGMVKAPATIKNFTLDSTCSIYGSKFCGMVAESDGSYSGEIHMEQLGNEGTVTTVNQNAGGIFGCCMSSVASIYINNCYTTGEVKGGNESGAISGWTGSDSHVTNTWSISKVTGYDSDAKYFYRYGTLVVDDNNWCKYGTEAQTLVDANLTSGFLTYTLNGMSAENPVWFQKLGQDEHPVLKNTGDNTVYLVKGEYTNVAPDAVESIAASTNNGNVYSIDGQLIQQNPTDRQLKSLKKGVYVVGNKKYMLK